MGLLDLYSRAARVTPLLLALLPAIVTLFSLVWGNFDRWASVAGFLVSAGVAVLGAQVARDAGRHLEPDLFRAWGGPPTTVLLRHRGPLSSVERAHRHSEVAAATGIALPGLPEEKANPEAADETYAAAVSILRQTTRDRNRFPAVFSDVVSYGFRRNLFGLRKLGLSIAGASLVGAMLITAGALAGKLPIPLPTALLAFAVDVLASAAWLRLVTPDWVRQAAFTYADNLLRAAGEVKTRPRDGS